jgi:hypothetical protein
MTAPSTDHGAPATTILLNIAQRERSRLRVRVIHDAGWPHLRLTAITSHGDIDLTFGLDDAEYLQKAIASGVDQLAALYEPDDPILATVPA